MNLLLAFLVMLPAFPGAQGFGADTVAGSGRHLNPPNTTVYRITSLADGGAGTLRECIDANVPRICIFETSGVIVLKTNLRILHPYITIAGETSPVPGIMLRNGELGILTHDVLVRYLHIRAGDDPAGTDPASRGGVGFYGDAPSDPGVYNVVVDHLSLSWSIDELADTWYKNVHDVTVSNSIISEALYDSIHPMGPQSTAIIVGEDSQRISYIRNLLASNYSRNPYFKAGTSTELINNVVYHWGYGTGGHDAAWAMADLSDYDHVGKPAFHTFIGNNYKCGPDSECSFAPIFSSAGSDALPSGSKIFVKSNLGPRRTADSLPEWDITNGLPKDKYCTSQPPLYSGASAVSGEKAYTDVLQNAGAYPKYRDAVDTRIVQEVQSGGGRFINCVAPDGTARCEKNAGGWPQYQMVRIAHQLPANPNSLQPSGYTALEEWLVQFPLAPANPTPTPSAAPTPSPTYPPCTT